MFIFTEMRLDYKRKRFAEKFKSAFSCLVRNTKDSCGSKVKFGYTQKIIHFLQPQMMGNSLVLY